MKKKLAISMFGQKRLSREGGIEIVVKELCTRMAQDGHKITCYNRSGHHVSGAEFDKKNEYEGICQKSVPTIEKKGFDGLSCPSNVLFVEKLQEAENPEGYMQEAFGSSVLTHKKEQQIKIEGEFKPTVDCLCATRRGLIAIL